MIEQKEYGTSGGFRAHTEGTPHANPHNLLGGHIRTFSSPSDPLFFSHHTYVDKIWAMWQDCHDYLEVDKSALTSVHYASHEGDAAANDAAKTNGKYDNIDWKMPFLAEKSKPEPNPDGCDWTDKEWMTGYSCIDCVKYFDDWCSGSDVGGQWDATCAVICTGKCLQYCGAKPGVNFEAHELFSKDSQGPSWDNDGTKNVADVTPRNMHDISDNEWLGYAYEPDEWDRRILNSALKNTCKLNKVFWHLDGASEARLLRHHELMSSNRRMSDDDETAEARDTILNYLESTISAVKDKSIFIDDKSKEIDALEQVVENECALLYKKNKVTKSISTIENNTFWRKWGMSKDDSSALVGKCSGI